MALRRREFSRRRLFFQNILRQDADNKVVKAAVYISAAVIALLILPIPVEGFLILDTKSGIAGFKTTFFNVIPIIRAGNKSFKKDEKGSKKAKDGGALSPYTVLRNICVTEIIQLCVVGAEIEAGAYLALAQSAATQLVYGYVRGVGKRTKLRNNIVLNSDSSDVGYCAKISGLINIFTILKLTILYFWSKINERKS